MARRVKPGVRRSTGARLSCWLSWGYAVIAFVRLPPPPGIGGTAALESLPALPASGYAACVARTFTTPDVEAALNWLIAVRTDRPTVRLGLIGTPEVCARSLASCPHPVEPSLTPEELVGGTLPPAVFAELQERSLEGQILDELTHLYGRAILHGRFRIQALISHAVAGKTVQSTARHCGCSVDTLERHLAHLGFSAGRLASAVRVRAFQLRVQNGAAGQAALESCGWHDREYYRRVLHRVREADSSLARFVSGAYGGSEGL